MWLMEQAKVPENMRHWENEITSQMEQSIYGLRQPEIIISNLICNQNCFNNAKWRKLMLSILRM
jgi:hypothetical protein